MIFELLGVLALLLAIVGAVLLLGKICGACDNWE